MNEFKINEVFTLGLCKMKVVVKTTNSCEGCAFEYFDTCRDIKEFTGDCSKYDRDDKTDVKFVYNEELNNE